MSERLFKVTILFCLFILVSVSFSFAVSDYVESSNIYVFDDSQYMPITFDTNGPRTWYLSVRNTFTDFPVYGVWYKQNSSNSLFIMVSVSSLSIPTSIGWDGSYGNQNQSSTTFDRNTNLYYTINQVGSASGSYKPYYDFSFNDRSYALNAVRDYIDNPPSSYTKNPNVDEFLANTLISMGIRYSQYSDALSIGSSAWNYIIDDSNWYIGSGDRNDKDIKWDIATAVSYANAQSNNYLDWYNGYKVNKDLTIALTKFISDNYIVSTLGQGTLTGYNVYFNGSYSYGTVGGTSGSGGTFGSSPNALSFYPASTITYFNGAYLHDNDVIDQDEFVYSPADVRKFIGYPSSAGIIDHPDSTNGTGIITDGNGDTIYNIDLDFPSFDWLADAIQAVLDFLDRLISTIADFLTQILDAILSLFSDAFESLTEFGEGIIEWLYAIIAGFSTIGSNYIPASLWAVILPFILINIGVGLIMFVMRSH